MTTPILQGYDPSAAVARDVKVNGAGELVVQGGGGGGGGGVAQLQVRDAPDLAWVNVGPANAWVPVEVKGPLAGGRLDVNLGSQTGAVAVNDNGDSLTVDGPLTDAQLRAAAVLVDLVEAVALEATLQAVRDRLPAALAGGRLDVNLGAGKAREETAAMTWVSARVAAPVANSIIVDTGALAAGEYDFDAALCAADTITVGEGLILEHRNAANAATLHNLGLVGSASSLQLRLRRYTIAANERLRVISGTAAASASSIYVAAIGQRLS